MKFISVLSLAIALGAAGGYVLYDLLPSTAETGAEAQMGAAVSSEAIAGRASIIDGDTIEIHGTRIRLHGIDAPESDQTCAVAGENMRCGQQAALALADRIGQETVSCDQRGRDRYDRIISVCHASGEDLNAWMVANGWAMAYRRFSTDYVRQEEAAAAAKIGIWKGEFTTPWEWRARERRAQERTQEKSNCNIKGNISYNTGERIYHLPGGEYYSRTKISPSKGERWFCSEAEARAAGWRRSMK
ncbi:MAG: thermonuclease family protein [Kiloniellaceae bacterium]